MREMRRLFRLSNIGVLLYAALNGLLLYQVWTMIVPGLAAAPEGILTFAALYLLCACLSMSPVGEWICRVFMGARRITRQDWNARLTPIMQEIRSGIIREYNYDLGDIQVFYVYDPLPSAFAVGSRSICVSTALMDCRDDVIRAALAQQTGRILNYDSMLALYVTVGNIFVLGLLLILQAIRGIVTLFGLLLSRGFWGRLFAILTTALTWIPVLLVTAAINLSYLIINLSDQRKTYEADAVAVRLDYGRALIRAIEEMDVEDIGERRNLWGILNRPHPGTHERIGRIQAAMNEPRGPETRTSQQRSPGRPGNRMDEPQGTTGQATPDRHTTSVLDWLGEEPQPSRGEPPAPNRQEAPRARAFRPINRSGENQETPVTPRVRTFRPL